MHEEAGQDDLILWTSGRAADRFFNSRTIQHSMNEDWDRSITYLQSYQVYRDECPFNSCFVDYLHLVQVSLGRLHFSIHQRVPTPRETNKPFQYLLNRFVKVIWFSKNGSTVYVDALTCKYLH